ncbi:MAG: glycosyltransferase [Planctomycetota bacterium]
MVAPNPILHDRSEAPSAAGGRLPAADAVGRRTARERGERSAILGWLRRVLTERDGQGPYVREMARFLRLTVPAGKRVLMFGAGTGELLAQLRPRFALGIDADPQNVASARTRYPELLFEVGEVGDTVTLQEPFDYIILNGVIGYTEDIQRALAALHPLCTRHTRLVLTAYSYLWEAPVRLAEAIGLKDPTPLQNWISLQDLTNLLYINSFEVIRGGTRMLWPWRGRPFEVLFNRFLARLPPFSWLGCLSFLVFRDVSALGRESERPLKVSVCVPCRNERGTIEDAVRRIPEMGSGTEIVFVDGHSTDGTPDEIERVMRAYPERAIKLLVQDGKGKGDAVRKGFAAATGDILMILDSDLTVPPEDLPKFYDTLVRGYGELVNGCRLIYPMEHGAMRLLNVFGNKFFALAFTWLIEQPLKDTLCGTKVLHRRDYQAIVDGRAHFGDFDPFGDFDLLFGGARQNLKIVEVPVRYRDRVYGATNIHRFRHGWLLLRMCAFAMRRFKFA